MVKRMKKKNSYQLNFDILIENFQRHKKESKWRYKRVLGMFECVKSILLLSLLS